jgi:predicted HAD superfamily Cof-like phosphohydrolase
MTPEQKAVKEFHEVMGMEDNKTPTLVDGETAGLRIAVIAEEFNEFIDGVAQEDLVEIADALGDLLYVIYGAANAYGIDLEPVFNEIHDSNMKKIDPETGKVKYREDGKVLKPKGWKKPRLAPIIEAQQGATAALVE